MKAKLVLLFLLITSATSNAQYNVVLIESDDQSNQAVSAFGNTAIQTPNLDKLAQEGTSFTAAYNMGCWSPAVCVPSRTMLFYGKYLWDSQKISKTNSPKSLPEIVKENGYHTYMTGKWHAQGKTPDVIFDAHGTLLAGQLKTYHTNEGHATDVTAKEAVNYIDNYKDKNPFFLYVAFNAPHVPRQTEQKYYDLYPTETINLPPSVQTGPLNPNIKYNYSPNPLQEKTMRKRVQQNNAMVSHMDERIGDILKALKNKGIYDKTIIIFMSDHGISFGENGVAGKVCLYEPSVTAPLIIKAPGLKANEKINDRIYLQDVYPSLLDLLEIAIPKHIDFKSLLPLVQKKETARPSIYLAMFTDQRGIIKGDEKLILYPESGDLEYYNLKKDPWETKNLKDIKTNKNNIKKLLLELKAWQKKVADKVDISNVYSDYLD